MEHRLFRAIVIAGCAIPASCARIEETPQRVDGAVAPSDGDVGDEQPAFELDSGAVISEPDTDSLDADAADVRHPSITK